MVLPGGFNIHVDDADNVIAQRFLDLLGAFDLQQYVRGMTHTRGHTLDLVIALPSSMHIQVIIDPPGFISDHFLVTCFFALARLARTVQRHLVTRRLNSINSDDFADAVRLSAICTVQPANHSVADFCEIYLTELRIVDVMAPPVTIVATDRLTSPWFDGDCHACHRVRRTRVGCLSGDLNTFNWPPTS